MKYWFGHPVKECECGFTTPDEKEFSRHLAEKRHKPKAAEPVSAKSVKSEKRTVNSELSSVNSQLSTKQKMEGENA